MARPTKASSASARTNRVLMIDMDLLTIEEESRVKEVLLTRSI
jgi:hypothetical protein